MKQFLSLLLLTLSAFIISCEFPQNPEEVLELRIDTNIFTHKGFVTVVDAQSQSNLQGNVLQAKISGPDVDKIVTEGGEKLTTWNLNDGFAAFAVNPEYRGFTDPINFDIEIYGTDYLTKLISVTITTADSITEIRETLLNLNSAPSGVAVKQMTATLSSGSNSSDVVVTTNESTTNTSAEIVVPANNKFKDANGTIISSGNLTAQVVYFDGSDESANRSSINSNVKSLIDEAGDRIENIILAPIATADINMSVGTSEVKEFETPINITLDVNPNSINPATGEKVKAGDQFNIYSTSDNGNWLFEGKGTLFSNSGALAVTFDTNHLSTFTVGNGVPLCDDLRQAFIPLPNNGLGYPSNYLGSYTAPTGITTYSTGYMTAMNGVTGIAMNNPPSGQSSLQISHLLGPNTTQTDLLDWCNLPNVNESLLDNLFLQGDVVNLNVSAKCAGNSVVIPSGVKLFVKYDPIVDPLNPLAGFEEVGVIQNGKISIPGITLGQEYELRIVYNEKAGTGKYVFNSTNEAIEDYPLPSEACTELGF